MENRTGNIRIVAYHYPITKLCGVTERSKMVLKLPIVIGAFEAQAIAMLSKSGDQPAAFHMI